MARGYIIDLSTIDAGVRRLFRMTIGFNELFPEKKDREHQGDSINLTQR
jgi:hypothetical protein